MQPQGAQWKPNPQPSRTNVMDDGAGCGRADEIEDACALIDNDDASTPQVRTNDNLLNIERTPLFAAFLGTSRGIPWNGSTRWRFLSKSQALLPGFSLRMVDCGLTRDRLFTIPALRGGTKDAAPGELSRPTVKSTSCSEAHAEPPRCQSARGEDWRSAEGCVRLKKSTFRRSTAAIFKPSSTPYPTQMAQAARTRPHPTTAGSHGGV
jgi:hypothetical protein